MKKREWINPREGLRAQLRELMAAMPVGEATRLKVLRSMWAQPCTPAEQEKYDDAGVRSADDLVALYEGA